MRTTLQEPVEPVKIGQNGKTEKKNEKTKKKNDKTEKKKTVRNLKFAVPVVLGFLGCNSAPPPSKELDLQPYLPLFKII